MSASPPLAETGAAPFLWAAAQRRATAQDRAGALVLLDELLREAPSHAPALRLAAELQVVDNPVAAANAAHRVIQNDPGDREAWELLGRALSAMGRHDEAIEAFRRVVGAQPTVAAAHANHSIALMRAGQPQEAAAAARRAVELDSNAPEGHAALGHALNLLHQPDDALAAFYAALRLRPGLSDALLGAARTHRELGQPGIAITALLRAAESAPQAPGPQVELATLLRECLQPDAARSALRKAAALAPRRAYFHSNLLLDTQYDPTIDEAVAAAEARRRGAEQVAAVRPVSLPQRDLSPDRPLRIGYVSADLYRHPVGWLGAAPIMAHDRLAVTVFVYANQTSYDDLTISLRQSVDAWVPIMGLDDDTVAARIAADGIDILVDLAGHTGGNRLPVFARRPAPIQVTWLGYSATTGLPTMDYMLLDPHYVSEGAQDHILERVLLLQETRFCYSPPDYAAEVAEPPSAAGGAVTFASFNNTAKLNDDVFALWSRVLTAVPGSRLLLKWRALADPQLQVAIAERFARYGIDRDRLAFEGHSPHIEMLRRYAEVDISLDPFPFSGGLTSCEALWMGVPVVTLPGSRPFSRQTHSILNVIGRAEWSAVSTDEYVRIAAHLAGDRRELAGARRVLRMQIAKSPLCDAQAFARALERNYHKMWKSYLKTL